MSFIKTKKNCSRICYCSTPSPKFKYFCFYCKKVKTNKQLTKKL